MMAGSKECHAMPRFFRKRSSKAGLAPGSLVYVGTKHVEPITIQRLSYKNQFYEEDRVQDIEALAVTCQSPMVHWVNINGVYDPKVVERFGKTFQIHPLLLEDVLNTAHRPKFEELEGHALIILKMLFWNEQESQVKSEQVSIILGKNYVLSFQEESGDHFDPVRRRIKENIGRICRVGADYLAYALSDAIVDYYFYILERMGEKIEGLQQEVVGKPNLETLDRIYQMKSELIFMRKAVFPLREVLSQLGKDESDLFDPSTNKYIRDLYDHVIQIVEGVEIYREMATEMINI
jgi:magnesium transporter